MGSVSTLVNSAITDAQSLVRQQIELAKAEVTQSAKQAAGKEADHDDHSKDAPGSGGVLKLSDAEITGAGIKVEALAAAPVRERWCRATSAWPARPPTARRFPAR